MADAPDSKCCDAPSCKPSQSDLPMNYEGGYGTEWVEIVSQSLRVGNARGNMETLKFCDLLHVKRP